MWALSTFSASRGNAIDSSAQVVIDERVDTTNITSLDRPNDNEMIQHFVREGSRMNVVVTGVDDLWSRSAPLQILREGMRLLSTLGAWSGEQERALALLEALARTGC